MTYQESIIAIVSSELYKRGELGVNQVAVYPKNYLFSLVGLVNKNFASINKDKSVANANALDLPIQALDSALDLVRERAEKTLCSGLNGLRNLGLIVWGHSYSLVEIIDDVEYPNVAPSNAEEKFILGAERRALKIMGYDTKRQVAKCGKWEEFKGHVMIEVKEVYPQYVHYNSAIRLNYNTDEIIKYIDGLNFTQEEFIEHLAEHKQNVNNEFLETMNKAVKSKNAGAKKKAIEGLVKLNRKTKELVPMTETNITYNNYYSSDKFIEDNKKVHKTVIDNKAKPLEPVENVQKHKSLMKEWYATYEPPKEHKVQLGFQQTIDSENISF